jgi:hypothetical protein
MKLMTAAFVLWLASAGLAAETTPEKTQPRSFDVPRHGKLTLSLPETWKHEVREAPGNLPPTVVLRPREGDDFKTLITPIGNPNDGPNFIKPENLKRMLQGNLQMMLPGAVEKDVAIQEFKAKGGTGYYFLVTDKAPKPGEYPYAVRSVVNVGDLLLSVTVLSRSKDSPGITGMIKALGEAEQKKD